MRIGAISLRRRAPANRGEHVPGKDFKKELKALYSAPKDKIVEVDAPKLDYLMINGKGAPRDTFAPAIGALYSVGYPLKFMIKARDPKKDYVVMPPETLYFMDAADPMTPMSEWRWVMAMLQPVKPSRAELEKAKGDAKAKHPELPIDDVRLDTLAEGHCVEALHVGPYDKEGPLIERMHAYMEEHGFEPTGAHHEIYLSDPNRVAPKNLKTIIRQPVKRAVAA